MYEKIDGAYVVTDSKGTTRAKLTGPGSKRRAILMSRGLH